jgi:hypothetical protein
MEPYQICVKHMKDRIEKKHICNLVCINMFEYKGNNTITELRTILQRESQNS